MPRHAPRDTRFMGPTAICDTCGTPAWECASAGLICHRCRVGVFMHRKFWTYTPCPDCKPGSRVVCPSCNGAGVIATPRDEVTVEDLREEYAKLADRYQWQRYAVPEQILERMGWAVHPPVQGSAQGHPGAHLPRSSGAFE